mmetsp:Transcript_92948/g.150069  ORF Transcript_92948/g.150069 Transcript_92948/m.150069 type:complete len:390 (-) Transcript_92948:534-1703(-)|eukprot:CAMPEP_0179447144 /NCGR_PEP_ID=MMETSP0799-20121207/30922_1 /TAXON_ID=46947 /ORGANISM="Geminigera cryophila, Strain CCMP2564" /LENGTH=389 /DNA_ID=CAMNT_0021237557 /DNA_START=98 /DNA_END=1267 /DNA_ORIENTATION=+
MAFVRALVLACAAASCAAFNPAVSAFGRVGSLRKSVSYAPAARTAPLSNHRAASASQIAMKGYEIDLTGKVAFIGGVGDASGYGWGIAKQLANAGATIVIGTWPPVLTLFERSIKKGFGEDSKLIDGSDMKIAKIYPLDAMFTDMSEVPQEIRENKRYAGLDHYDIKSCAEAVKRDFGKVDILVHSLANGPEVTRPLLETTRAGYLAASSASAYSMVAMLSAFGPMMPPGSSAVSLTYLASERVVPGYGGGMSSAKAQLESDTKVLAWEAGRKYGIRVNTISAGPLASRAAIAIKKGAAGERNYIDYCIDYNMANAPLPKPLFADDVGRAALGLCSELSGAVTGTCAYVDNGMHAMGLSLDSSNFKEYIDKQSGDPWDGWKPDVYLKNL